MSAITKEELLRIPRLRKHIKRKMQRIELYETRATGGAIDYKERVQSSVNDSASDCLCEAVDLRRELIDDTKELNDLINRAYDFMRTLDEVLHRDIVYARYIVGLPWNDVAKTFNYSNQRIFQKHREILRKL
ncbi:MAG: hypothetical protein HXM76_05045 [Mogibacterium diversum]|nr:hypothetical protein [Mogibacterium diversum]